MSDTDPPTGGTPADDAAAASSSSDDDAADATPIGDLVARLQVLRARLLALGWTRIRDTYRCETCGFLCVLTIGKEPRDSVFDTQPSFCLKL